MELDVPFAPLPLRAPPEPPDAVMLFEVHTRLEVFPEAPAEAPPDPTVTVTDAPPVIERPVPCVTVPPFPPFAFDPVAPAPPPPTTS